MEHTMTISGGNDGTVTVRIDESEPTVFSTGQTISAETIYDSLRYSPGDSYDLKKGDLGKVQPKVFEAFSSLYEEIVKKTNAISVQASVHDDSVDTLGAMPPSTNVYDEDIPF